VQANTSEVVLDAADRDPVVDGLNVFIQVLLNPPGVILRFRTSSVLEVSPIPQVAEAPRKTTSGLSVVAQDDHAGRIRIRAFQANLLDPHIVVVVGLKPSPTGEPLLKLLLQASLEGMRIRGRLGHLGTRPRFTVHPRMVRAPNASPYDRSAIKTTAAGAAARRNETTRVSVPRVDGYGCDASGPAVQRRPA
jgi:hypothetical protein